MPSLPSCGLQSGWERGEGVGEISDCRLGTTGGTIMQNNIEA